MTTRHHLSSTTTVSLCLLAVAVLGVALFAAPVGLSLDSLHGWRSIADVEGDGWGLPMGRSVVFACVTTTLEVVLGFLLGVGMLGDRSRGGHWSAAMLLPILAGNASVAFLCKIIVMDAGWVSPLIAERDPLATWTLLLALQVWQYVPPFAYLVFVRLRLQERARVDFADVAGLSAGERLRDLYWPHCRNLAGLLALFAFGESFYEHTKSGLVLRTSPGTGTEVITGRLQRYYETWKLADPVAAAERTLAVAAVTTIVAVVLAMLVAGALCKLADVGVSLAGRVSPSAAARRRLALTIRVGLTITAVGPFFYLVAYLQTDYVIGALAVARSAVLSALALGAAMAVVVAFAFSARLAWPRRLQRLDSGSLPFYGGLYLLHLVPSIAVAFCAYHWIAATKVGSRGGPFVVALWLVSQVIVAFPVLASFAQVANCRVLSRELDFQRAIGSTWGEQLRNSFIGRLRSDYFMIALFGFALVWNESVVNAVMSTMSRNIPSLAVEMAQRIGGRSAAYSEAAWAIFTSLAPIVAWILLWIAFVRRWDPTEATA